MCIVCVAIATLPLLQPMPVDNSILRHAYADPIDAISVTLPTKESIVTVRGRTVDGDWTAWETMEIDDEQDPTLFESTLVLFPVDVTAVEIVGDVQNLHPIRIDDAPAQYDVAGPNFGTPTILTRKQWGANDELLYSDTDHIAPAQDPSESTNDNGTPPASEAVNQRITTCEAAQKNHPEDFKTTKKTTKGENGRTLRWSYSYSKRMDLIAVHHTAVAVGNDARSGAERVRAIYQYHAVNRGWGDVGYHYLIDEDGQIYEGKSGGKYVVGGHAYCNNVNTLGVALLGNFEEEKPSQNQMKALQWLIDDLADTYDIDLRTSVTYHGETYASPIVGHGDLVSTSCPGFYVRQTLAQVRSHVEDGDLSASISFPKKPSSSKSSRSSSQSRTRSARSTSSASSTRTLIREGISVLGNSTLGGRPGGEVPFSVRYTTGKTGAKAGERIADVQRSDQAIGVWQLINGVYEPVRGHIITESSVPWHSTIAVQMKVQIPVGRGPYSITIGDATYTITPSGRVAAPGSSSSRRFTRTSSSSRSSSLSSKNTEFRMQNSTSRRSSSLRSRASSSPRGPTIKIRLESRDSTLESCDDADIEALKPLYRGTLRCVDIAGDAAIINTVAMEDYLMGLSEEPDTEPYEKQRAFAIAARTYAAHYMGTTYRKFPGKPYDGSDSPAIFQKYTGKSFEQKNPRWLDAVKDTSHLVLMKDGHIIRPPYFSSDDGMTKSPADIGWGSFPFAEIFSAKPDPWCEGMENRGHGVGMSGCGAEGQANEGKTGEEILEYYYPGTDITPLS